MDLFSQSGQPIAIQNALGRGDDRLLRYLAGPLFSYSHE